ncbi:MAG: four helix bundle protein [Tepidisphaera sp.]
MKYDRFEDLKVWKDAARFFIRVAQFTDDPVIRRKGDFADQLERASLSISNNIAEGFEAGTTELLLRYIYIAKGSAGECRSMLSIATELPVSAETRAYANELRADAEEIGRQLGGWSRHLQNSDIEGQRRLTNDSREHFHQTQRRESFAEQIRKIAEEAAAKRERERLAESE